jgi:hypothetical protein
MVADTSAVCDVLHGIEAASGTNAQVKMCSSTPSLYPAGRGLTFIFSDGKEVVLRRA